LTQIINDINIAAEEIKKGNVVGLPTETVYGLGANALDPEAVLKIYEVKERPKFNPLIVHVLKNDIDKYVKDIPANIIKLIEKFSPGPITFVLKRRDVIPDIVCAGLETVAIRVPSHDVFRQVLEITQLPISAPSANRFGKLSPTSAEDVLKELDGKIDYILDGGKSDIGIESTVVSHTDGEVKILRHGFISKEDIEKVIGEVAQLEEYIEGDDGIRPASPGMIKNHYAPNTPLYLTKKEFMDAYSQNEKVGILETGKYDNIKDLAVNLFSDMRKLDEKKYDFILTTKVKNEGIGRAINDRLLRAAKGFLINVNNKMKFIDK
jgi:L-threonylcarbamoyladenylate synthase